MAESCLETEYGMGKHLWDIKISSFDTYLKVKITEDRHPWRIELTLALAATLRRSCIYRRIGLRQNLNLLLLSSPLARQDVPDSGVPYDGGYGLVLFCRLHCTYLLM